MKFPLRVVLLIICLFNVIIFPCAVSDDPCKTHNTLSAIKYKGQPGYERDPCHTNWHTAEINSKVLRGNIRYLDKLLRKDNTKPHRKFQETGIDVKKTTAGGDNVEQEQGNASEKHKPITLVVSEGFSFFGLGSKLRTHRSGSEGTLNTYTQQESSNSNPKTVAVVISSIVSICVAGGCYTFCKWNKPAAPSTTQIPAYVNAAVMIPLLPMPIPTVRPHRNSSSRPEEAIITPVPVPINPEPVAPVIAVNKIPVEDEDKPPSYAEAIAMLSAPPQVEFPAVISN